MTRSVASFPRLAITIDFTFFSGRRVNVAIATSRVVAGESASRAAVALEAVSAVISIASLPARLVDVVIATCGELASDGFGTPASVAERSVERGSIFRADVADLLRRSVDVFIAAHRGMAADGASLVAVTGAAVDAVTRIALLGSRSIDVSIATGRG